MPLWRRESANLLSWCWKAAKKILNYADFLFVCLFEGSVMFSFLSTDVFSPSEEW